jgi:hypothetical protein
MVPSTFVTIEGDLPLTPNGKVDRKALSERFAAEPPAPKARLSPAPGLEQAIAGVWRDLLKIADIGAEDNFFELGGHSLLALRAVSLIAKQTGRKIDPRTFYFQSLRQIAASAAGLAASKISPP